MLQAEITFFGQQAIVACDGKCEKAWGINSRPRINLDPENKDDYAWLADNELGLAPDDPGTHEGDHGKPTSNAIFPNKWCVRECERCRMFQREEEIILPDFSTTRFNI